MKIHAAPKDTIWFIPDFSNNRELPSDRQARFQIRTMTDAESQTFQAEQVKAAQKVKKRDRWKIQGDALRGLEEKIILDHVVKIEGLCVETSDGQTIQIEDGKALLAVLPSWPQAISRSLIDSLSEAVLSYDPEDEGFLTASN